jgi:hypothetical protein
MRRSAAIHLAAVSLLAAALCAADAGQAAADSCKCDAPYTPQRVRSCCFDNGQWRKIWMCVRPRDPHHPRLIYRPLPCNGRRF